MAWFAWLALTASIAGLWWLSVPIGQQPIDAGTAVLALLASCLLLGRGTFAAARAIAGGFVGVLTACLLLGLWQAAYAGGVLTALLLLGFLPVGRDAAPGGADKRYVAPWPVTHWPWYTRPLLHVGNHVYSLRPSADTLRSHWGDEDRLMPNDRRRFEALFGSDADRAALRQRGLDLFDASVLQAPSLSPMGSFLLRLMLRSMLHGRADVVRHYCQQADAIASNPRARVVTPFVVAGLPRTGSTLLQRLLACDPRARAVRTYELEMPLPPLAADADPLADARIKKTTSISGLFDLFLPGWRPLFLASHPWVPEQPEEEFAYSLIRHGIVYVLDSQQSPQFRAWRKWYLDPADKRPVFMWQRRLLEIMAHARPVERWVLKAPMYGFYPGLVFDEFPDARLVITHRSPVDVIPSVARLDTSFGCGFHRENQLDQREVARASLAHWKKAATRPLKYRRQHPEREPQILDLYYDDIAKRPVATVQRIYEHFGVDFTDDHRKNIEDLMNNDPRSTHGRHSYSLDDFGITADEIVSALRPYMDRYFPSTSR